MTVAKTVTMSAIVGICTVIDGIVMCQVSESHTNDISYSQRSKINDFFNPPHAVADKNISLRKNLLVWIRGVGHGQDRL